jgi:hypothetical protein
MLVDMATPPQILLILQQMREMTEADLSVLQASVDTPDSSMTTAPGSPNEALWSAMEKLGWMVRTTDELDPPGVGRFLLQVYSLTPAGQVGVSHLLSIVREGKITS